MNPKIEEAKGKLEQAIGSLTGNTSLKNKGRIDYCVQQFGVSFSQHAFTFLNAS